MHIGFSYVGLCFLALLFVPNLFWTKHQPAHYASFARRENRFLLLLERTGEVLVTCIILVFSDFNIRAPYSRCFLLLAAFLLMLLYELYWVRYFRSAKTMKDFYASLSGIPLPGATLPVAAVLLLAVYGKNPLLFLADIVLGVGHIGIHLAHAREVGAL